MVVRHEIDLTAPIVVVHQPAADTMKFVVNGGPESSWQAHRARRHRTPSARRAETLEVERLAGFMKLPSPMKRGGTISVKSFMRCARTPCPTRRSPRRWCRSVPRTTFGTRVRRPGIVGSGCGSRTGCSHAMRPRTGCPVMLGHRAAQLSAYSGGTPDWSASNAGGRPAGARRRGRPSTSASGCASGQPHRRRRGRGRESQAMPASPSFWIVRGRASRNRARPRSSRLRPREVPADTRFTPAFFINERHRPTPLPATGLDCSPRRTRYGLAAQPTAGPTIAG